MIPSPGTVQAVWSLATHSLYQNWAANYNHTLERLGYTSPYCVAEKVAALFAPEARLLELGAGTGLVGEWLQYLGSPLRLLGADLSLAMLHQMTCQVYSDRHIVDASKPLLYPPDSFDGVLCAGLLEYLVEPGEFFRHVAAVLVPGGRLVFTYAPAEWLAVEQVETTSLLLRHHPEVVWYQLGMHGFRLLSEETIDAYWNNGEQIQHRLLVVERQANLQDEAN